MNTRWWKTRVECGTQSKAHDTYKNYTYGMVPYPIAHIPLEHHTTQSDFILLLQDACFVFIHHKNEQKFHLVSLNRVIYPHTHTYTSIRGIYFCCCAILPRQPSGGRGGRKRKNVSIHIFAWKLLNTRCDFRFFCAFSPFRTLFSHSFSFHLFFPKCKQKQQNPKM